MQGAGAQGGAAAGLAVQHHLEVARLQRGGAAELEFQQAARDVDRARQVAGGVLVGLAHVDQYIGFADRLFGILHGNLLYAALGGNDEVMGGFHGGRS